MTEQEVAGDLRKKLLAKWPDNIWQVSSIEIGGDPLEP